MKFLITMTLAIFFGSCTASLPPASNLALDASLPGDLSKRTLLDGAWSYRDLSDAIGGLVYVRGDKAVLVRTIWAPEYTPNVIALNDLVYHSLVTRAAAAQGSYLTFAAGVSAGSAVEVTIRDLSSASVPGTAIPIKELRRIAASPMPRGVTQRLWISRAIGSSIDKLRRRQVQLGASGGNVVVGADGTAYLAESEQARERAVAVYMIDLDDLVSSAPQEPMETKAVPLTITSMVAQPSF